MDLTDRERETLLLVAKDKSNLEIAQALGISEDTIETHVRNICAKLGARSRLGAVMIGLVKGEIPFDELVVYWLKYTGNP